MFFFWLVSRYCFQTQFQWLSIFRSFSSWFFSSSLGFFFRLSRHLYIGMFAKLKFPMYQKKHQKFTSLRYFVLFFRSFQSFRLRFIQFFFCLASFVHHQTEVHIWNASKGSHMPNWEQAYIESKKKIKELTKSQVFIFNVLPYIPLLFSLFFAPFTLSHSYTHAHTHTGREILYRYCFLFFKYLLLFWFCCCANPLLFRSSECVSTEFFASCHFFFSLSLTVSVSVGFLVLARTLRSKVVVAVVKSASFQFSWNKSLSTEWEKPIV